MAQPTSISKNLKVYKSLKEIPAIRFHEIKFEGNIKLIDKDHSEYKKYGERDLIALNEAWIDLYDQYFEKTDSTSLRKELRNKKQTLDLLLSINLIEKIIELLEFLGQHEEYVPSDAYLDTMVGLANDLKRINPRLKYDSTKPIKEQLQLFKSVLGGLETRYRILHRQSQNIKEADIMLFYQIKSAIEDLFGRNIDENVNMLQWIAYEKDFKKKLANRQNTNAKTKARGK